MRPLTSRWILAMAEGVSELCRKQTAWVGIHDKVSLIVRIAQCCKVLLHYSQPFSMGNAEIAIEGCMIHEEQRVIIPEGLSKTCLEGANRRRRGLTFGSSNGRPVAPNSRRVCTTPKDAVQILHGRPQCLWTPRKSLA